VKSETFLELRLDLIGSDRRDLQLSVWVEFSKKEKVSKDSISKCHMCSLCVLSHRWGGLYCWIHRHL